jgi:antitoxin MazE
MYIIEAAMTVSKWGNSLAVRLPKKLVDKLGLKEGEKVEVTVQRASDPERRKRLAALKKLRAMRWAMPKDYKFDREEAHERGWRLDDEQG